MKTSALLLFLFCLCAPAQSRTVTLNWTASTTPGVSYNVYRASGSCPASGAVKINAAAVSAVTYVDSTVTVGTYCYYVTAVGGGLESVPSNNAVAVVAPVAPTGLTVTPSSATLKVRQTLQFLAAGGVSPVKWSLSQKLGTISSTGLYTAPSGFYWGSSRQVRVIATSGTEVVSALVTVTKR